MRYINAQDILPEELIRNIQQYADGITLYIPRREENRRPWGCSTTYREELRTRNAEIRAAFEQGESPEELAERFHLSEKSIRRILRQT